MRKKTQKLLFSPYYTSEINYIIPLSWDGDVYRDLFFSHNTSSQSSTDLYLVGLVS